MHIKVLRDTPFDKAGSKMTLSDFRVKYSYISTDSVTDEELVKYLQIERAAVLCNNASGNYIGNWFEVEDFSIDQINKLPNDFIHEGVRYAKQMDGCYHLFVAGAQIIPENSVMIKTIHEVEQILSKVKFKRMMLVTSNDVKKT